MRDKDRKGRARRDKDRKGRTRRDNDRKGRTRRDKDITEKINEIKTGKQQNVNSTLY